MKISSFNSYSTYDSSVNDSRVSQNVQAVNEKDNLDKELESTSSKASQATEDVDSKTESNNAPKHSNPADFTFDFKKDNRFNLEGATKDYEDINVNKALSDMKKDSVLEQYKFFVDSPNLGTDSDGTVRIVRK